MNIRIFSSLFYAVLLCSCANTVSIGPHPGTEASLRRYVESLEAGQPNYNEMTPQLADVVRRQLPSVLAWIKPLGALQSITFEPRDSLRADNYLVTFEHGKAEWTIGPLTADGKADRRGFHIVDPFGPVPGFSESYSSANQTMYDRPPDPPPPPGPSK